MYGRLMRAGGAMLVVAAAAALAGCTGGGSDSTAAAGPSGSSSAASSASRPASAPATGAGPKHSAPPAAGPAVPTNVPNVVAKRKQVSLTGCKAAAGGWGASGTASNNGTDPAKYTVTVFFTNAKATVVGTASTDVTVAPGKKQNWSATGKFAAPSPTLCVLRGVG